MISILRKAKLADRELRILVLGLDNAGKTTILARLLDRSASQADIRARVGPTLGFEIRTIDWDDVQLNVWDVGGQKTLRTYWQNYFEKTDTLIWVLDGTDKARISDAREELTNLLLEERLTGTSLLVLVNKADVPGCLTASEAETALGLHELPGDRNQAIIQCSAMIPATTSTDAPCTDAGADVDAETLQSLSSNLPKAMDWVVKDARDRLFIF